MKQIPRSIAVKQVLVKRTTLSLGVGLLCMGVFVGTSEADRKWLSPPFYSFDGESPTIEAVTDLDAYDILQLEAGDDVVPSSIVIAVHGNTLGLGDPDELNALSSGNLGVVYPPGLPADKEFMLLFSIDRDSTGILPPHPALIHARVPWNALEQAVKLHAAADQFMALDEFTRGAALGNAGSRVAATNVQTRNQYNEGGTDFGGEPPRGSGDGARSEGSLEQDSVVSMMLSGRSEVQYATELTEVYFSVKTGSPSLGTLGGGGGDAATIFYNPIVKDATTVFATSAALRLTPADDIDAMIVFDTNENHVFDGTDQVLFSLTRTSPSLATIDGASPIAPAADVFTHSADDDPDQPPPSPRVFANADNLGLGHPLDNVDALDYFVCEIGGDVIACGQLYGIRVRGVPAVSDWGLVVFTLLVLGTGALVIRRRSSRVA